MYSSQYTEKQLFSSISTGDEAAFKTLYEAYFHRLASFIYKLSKSRTTVEEIIQEVFTRLWINRAALADIDIPEAYIFSIARNKTIDHLRKLAKETNLVETLQNQLQQTGESNAEEKLNLHELQTLIEQALQQLSEQKRRIFQLSKQEGLSHDEIAQRLNISKSTVKNHLSETLAHLRSHLGKQQDAEFLLLLFLLKSL